MSLQDRDNMDYADELATDGYSSMDVWETFGLGSTMWFDSLEILASKYANPWSSFAAVTLWTTQQLANCLKLSACQAKDYKRHRDRIRSEYESLKPIIEQMEQNLDEMEKSDGIRNEYQAAQNWIMENPKIRKMIPEMFQSAGEFLSVQPEYIPSDGTHRMFPTRNNKLETLKHWEQIYLIELQKYDEAIKRNETDIQKLREAEEYIKNIGENDEIWNPPKDRDPFSNPYEYHSGGFVGGGSGSGSEVMAVLQEGEFVVPLDTINNFLSLVNTAKESNAALSQMKSSISAAKEQTKQISDTKNSPSIEEAFEYSKKVTKNMDIASAGAKIAASVLTGLPNLDALNELTKNITNPDSAANAKSLSDQLRTISGDARQIGYAFMDIDGNIGRAVQSTGDLGYGISSVVDAFSAEKFNLGSLGQGMQGIASGIGGIFGFEAGSDEAEVMNGISSAGSALASLATGDIGGAIAIFKLSPLAFPHIQ